MKDTITFTNSEYPIFKHLSEKFGVKILKETALGRDVICEIKFKDTMTIYKMGQVAAVQQFKPQNPVAVNTGKQNSK